MMVKIALILLLTIFTGVCPRRPREIYVKAGEMVALYCPRGRGYNQGDAKLIWTSYTTQRRDLTNMSAAEQRQMGVLFHLRRLVILNASENHRGNYSCSQRNASSLSWFRLKVYEGHEERIQYSQRCYTQESCTLICPDSNIPAPNTPNITSTGITWHKEGESSPKDTTPYYFSSVEKKDHGVYTCTRSYLHYGQLYNMTFTVVLDVQPKEPERHAVITSPKDQKRYAVELGSTMVINCTADLYSDFDELFWSSGESFIERNNSFPVFYNYTRENAGDQIKMTVSLVFKEVSKEDLSKNYTCNLQSVSGSPTFVTINLAQKEKQAVITSPKDQKRYAVELGSTAVINCTADMYSDFDELFWSSGESFIERNNSFPVFYNYTRENDGDQIKMTVSLVFKEVSKEDLSKNYTCNLQSVSGSPTFVTINLAQKVSPSAVSLALGIVGVVVVIVATVVVYVKLKMDIALFLRDTLCCYRRSSDGKSFDAFLLCYKSVTDTGLNADDRKRLESDLEERFGYSLCLHDRDVPGNAVAQVVLDCIEQSRRVVLVPTSPDLGPGCDLLNNVHEALVERQTRLVFIKTETKEESEFGSFPEALQRLGAPGDCVTWKGISSMQPSSSFWKQLRYYLPAPQHPQKTRLLPQSDTQDDVKGAV